MLIVNRSGRVRIHSTEDGGTRGQAQRIRHKRVSENNTFAADAINVRCMQQVVAGQR